MAEPNIFLTKSVAAELTVNAVLGSSLGESFSEYASTDGGKPYFTVKIGRIGGMVLDAGEDKLDTNIAYGDIADYTEFRREQLDFIKSTPIVGEVKLVLCHVPFASFDTPFNDIFAEWTEALNEKGIDLMLAGHRHELYMFGAGESKINETVANFPVAVGSKINKHVTGTYVGTAIVISKDEITLRYTDAGHNVLAEHTVEIVR